jgi:hypothetical protein
MDTDGGQPRAAVFMDPGFRRDDGCTVSNGRP